MPNISILRLEFLNTNINIYNNLKKIYNNKNRKDISKIMYYKYNIKRNFAKNYFKLDKN